MSARIEKYKRYYTEGAWSTERVQTLLDKGKITEEEYGYILSI